MNNDRPPACSPGIGEDGKQAFKLQWPNCQYSAAAASHHAIMACNGTAHALIDLLNVKIG